MVWHGCHVANQERRKRFDRDREREWGGGEVGRERIWRVDRENGGRARGEEEKRREEEECRSTVVLAAHQGT